MCAGSKGSISTPCSAVQANRAAQERSIACIHTPVQGCTVRPEGGVTNSACCVNTTSASDLDTGRAVVQLRWLQPGSDCVLLVPAAGAAAGLASREVVHGPRPAPDLAVVVVESAEATPDLVVGKLQAQPQQQQQQWSLDDVSGTGDVGAWQQCLYPRPMQACGRQLCMGTIRGQQNMQIVACCLLCRSSGGGRLTMAGQGSC